MAAMDIHWNRYLYKSRPKETCREAVPHNVNELLEDFYNGFLTRDRKWVFYNFWSKFNYFHQTLTNKNQKPNNIKFISNSQTPRRAPCCHPRRVPRPKGRQGGRGAVQVLQLRVAGGLFCDIFVFLVVKLFFWIGFLIVFGDFWSIWKK